MQDLEEIQDKLLSSVTVVEDDENKEKKEEDEAASASQFIVPKKKGPRAIRHSPFYRVLSELIQERAPSIEALRIDTLNNQETGREAFVIHLDNFPTHNLFPGYRFRGRHFSIDKFYLTSGQSSQNGQVKHGYMPIHYTEFFLLETTDGSETPGESITVHAYLNKQGQYLYPQIKKRSDDSGKITDLKIGREQEELLKTNVNTSTEVLSPLFEERQARYLKLKKEADELEAELIKLSSEFQNNTSLERYKVKAKTFIELINRLNQYTELADSRGHSLTVRLKDLEAWSKKIQDAIRAAHPKSDILPAQLDESEEPDETTGSVVESNDSEELIKLYTDLIQDLQNSVQKLGTKTVYLSENLKKIKEKHEIVRKTNQQLMALFEFPDTFLNNSTRKGKIQKLFGKVKSFTTEHEKQGLELLKQEVLRGNITAVKDLFIMFGSNLEDIFYKKLLNFLVNEKSAIKKKKLIEVCEFFNANTEAYRALVLNFSNQEKYIMRPEELNPLFSHLNDKTVQIDYTCEASILFRLYCNKDLQSFQILLEHGANPNTWGLTKKDNPRKVLSIFNVIACWNTTWYADYAKSLLRYGANPNELYTIEENYANLREKISDIKAVRRKGITGKSQVSIVHTNTEWLSSLEFFKRRSDLEFYKFLLPYMSGDVIAFAFSKMAETRNFNAIRFTSLQESNPPVKFFNNQRDAHKAAAIVCPNIDSLNGLEEGPFFNVFLYENSGCQKKCEMLKMAYQTLTKKLKDIDIRQFDELYQRLFKQGATQKLLPEAGSAPYYYFSGCMFLLMAATSNLSSETEKLNLVGRYHSDLSKQLQSAASARFSNSSEYGYKENMIKMYKNWSAQIRVTVKAFKEPAPQGTTKFMSNSESESPALLFSAPKPKIDLQNLTERKELQERADSPDNIQGSSRQSEDDIFEFHYTSFPKTDKNLILPSQNLSDSFLISNSSQSSSSSTSLSEIVPSKGNSTPTTISVTPENSTLNVYFPSGWPTRSSNLTSSSEQSDNPLKQKVKKKKKKKKKAKKKKDIK